MYTVEMRLLATTLALAFLLSIILRTWVILSPLIECRETTNSLTSLSMDGLAKESCPKYNPQPGWGLNPGPRGWQSEILATVLTLHRLQYGAVEGLADVSHYIILFWLELFHITGYT